MREDVTIEAEVRVVWPQAKECGQHFSLEPPEGSSPADHFRPLTSRAEREYIVFCSASRFVMVCYSSNKT